MTEIYPIENVLITRRLSEAELADELRRELDDTLLTVKSVKATIEYIEERIKAALTKYEKGV